MFKLNIYLYNKKTLSIIDTGADVSIIHTKNVPHNINISPIKSDVIIKSANGTSLSICGKVKTIVTVGKKSYEFEAFVTDKEPTTTILGRNFIEKNMEILYKICQNGKKSKVINTIEKTEIANQSLTQILDNFKNSFNVKISQNNFCSIGSHSIKLVKNSQEDNLTTEYQ
ncbi:retrotransposon-like protein 1 [Conglomerata obtusa]